MVFGVKELFLCVCEGKGKREKKKVEPLGKGDHFRRIGKKEEEKRKRRKRRRRRRRRHVFGKGAKGEGVECYFD